MTYFTDIYNQLAKQKAMTNQPGIYSIEVMPHLFMTVQLVAPNQPAVQPNELPNQPSLLKAPEPVCQT